MRLPGKTLSPILGDTRLLACVVSRFNACRTLSSVIVATTVNPNDDLIASWCIENAVPYFRGSEDDVLDRVVGAARLERADAIVQMGADSAYLDFQLIDKLVGKYLQGGFDYVCNDLTLTYPLGIYGHVVRMEVLAELNKRSDLTMKDRGDVVRPIFEQPARYSILNVEAPPELRHPELRLTIDYPEDLIQARAVYAYFNGRQFTTAEVIELFTSNPEMFAGTRNLAQHSAPFMSVKK